MNTFDFAIAYKWIYDREFTELIEQMFQAEGLSTFVINQYNVSKVKELLENGDLKFKAIIDRASDEDEKFQVIADFMQTTDTFVINGYQEVENAIDKAKMHQKLVELKLPVVDSIIIPPYDEIKELNINEENLKRLGSPFVIKPSYYSGGAEGVVVDATSILDIEKSRKINTDDALLLQRRIYPAAINGRRIWMRVFWFFDEAIPLWWNDQSHLYDSISETEFKQLDLKRTVDYSKQIAELSKLEYFSTEYTIDFNNDLYIIDYVNDQCDMRMKSQHFDGVPDWLVKRFIEKMIAKVKTL